MTYTAPRIEKPVTVAVGTAAYPVGLAVGITMLEVGPGRLTLPIAASLVVSTAKTVLLRASKVAAIFLVGDIAIKPGEAPALSCETRGKVSFRALMITRLPEVKVEETPCEARTRFFNPLGGFLDLLLPQEIRLRLADNPTAKTRMRLFKRQAPNGMKKEDLIAKWWIITEPAPPFMRARVERIWKIAY